MSCMRNPSLPNTEKIYNSFTELERKFYQILVVLFQLLGFSFARSFDHELNSWNWGAEQPLEGTIASDCIRLHRQKYKLTFLLSFKPRYSVHLGLFCQITEVHVFKFNLDEQLIVNISEFKHGVYGRRQTAKII